MIPSLSTVIKRGWFVFIPFALILVALFNLTCVLKQQLLLQFCLLSLFRYF